jgi:hypothetical protein
VAAVKSCSVLHLSAVIFCWSFGVIESSTSKFFFQIFSRFLKLRIKYRSNRIEKNKALKKYDKQDQQEKAALMNATPVYTTQQQPAARTPNKNRTGRKIEHGQANH